MPETLKVSIVSPAGEIFSGQATSVQVPGTMGQMTILPKHAAILSSLTTGKIIINSSDQDPAEFVIDTGFMENDQDVLTIIVEGLNEN